MSTSRTALRESRFAAALLLLGLATSAARAQTPAVQLQVRDEQHHHMKMDTGKYRVYEVLLEGGDAMLFHEHKADNVAVILSLSDITNEVENGQKTDVSLKPGLVSFAAASTAKPYVHRILLRGGAPFRNVTIELLQPLVPTPAGDSPEPVDPALAMLRESPRGRAYRLNLEPDQAARLPSRASDVFVVCLSDGSVVQRTPGQPDTTWGCSFGDYRLLAQPREAVLKNEGTKRVELVVIALQ